MRVAIKGRGLERRLLPRAVLMWSWLVCGGGAHGRVGVRVAIKDGVARAPLARARGTDVVVADLPGWRTLGSPVRTDGVESG